MATTRELLARMQAAVQGGDMEKARELGNSAPTRLAVTASELNLGAQLSQGAESVVRVGSFNGQDAAVKKMRIATSADLERFRWELTLLSSIDHPNVVKLLGARALPPDYMLVLPLEANNLWHMVYEEAWRPSWDELLRIAWELASALDHIHFLGIVHRDVKPANILMGHDGHIRLADFGIATWVSELAAPAHSVASLQQRGMPSGGFHKKRMVGTLEYMAPELLLKESAASSASDVYSFSVTIAELATAMVPFSDCTKERPECHTVLEMGYGRQEIAAAVACEGLRPTLTPNAPPGFNELLSSCWSRHPHSRPNMESVLRVLEGITQAVQVQQVGLPSAGAAGPDAESETIDNNGGSITPTASSPDSGVSEKTALVDPTSELSSAEVATMEGMSQYWGAAIDATAGSYEAAGPRESMEDRHIIVNNFCDRPDMMLLAVFDGHRGAQAASFASAHLPSILQHCILSCTSLHAALLLAFQLLDAQYRTVWEAEKAERQAKGRKDVLYPGCTAIVALLVGKMLYVANAGDCRAVLCQNRTAKVLSRDHTAALSDERERIQACGGSVAWLHGSWRIGKSGLQVSRCLGDFDVKGLGVTCDPEVTLCEVTSEDLCLVLASDGLWDTMASQEAVGLVMDTVKHPDLAAKRLVMESLARGGNDNVTAIVAFLQPVSTLEKVFGAGVVAHPAQSTFFGSRRAALEPSGPSKDEYMDTY